MKYYKLTDQNLKTHNGFQWTLNKWQKTSGKGGLCSEGWLHCYNDPLLAVLLNPIHANFDNPKLFKCECKGKTKNDKLKFGFAQMRIVKEIPLPKITTEQKVKFAILCALEVYEEPKFIEWANNWLSNKDRSEAATAAWAEAVAAAAAAAAAARAWARAWAEAEADILKNKDLIRIAKKALE